MKNKLMYIAILVSLILGITVGILVATKYGSHEETDKSNHEHKESIIELGEQVWTCSMHPQVNLPEPGDCPICGMDLIPMASMSNSDTEIGFQMTENAVKLANIQTSIIGNASSSGTKEISLSGKIALDETQASNLVAHVPGRIEKLHISYTGEKVNRGQKIAEVYSPELITAQRELLEAKKLEEISPDLYASAKQKLKFWKLGEKDIDAVISTGIIKETFSVYADYTGVVTERKVSVGDYLRKGEVLFALQNLNSVWAEFDAYERDLGFLDIGNKIDFKVSSMTGHNFSGIIEFIDPIINPKTRIAKIRVSVKNTSNKLKPEMFISGNISSKVNSESILIVPKTAVLWTGERSVVYVKVPDIELPSFEYKEVVLGESLGDSYVVKEGLHDGDEVVTNGAFVIDAASQLNNRASMMNRNVKSPSNNLPAVLPNYIESTPKEFKNQLKDLTNSYLKLKNDLVNSDTNAATESIHQLDKSLSEVDMTLVKEESHEYWMKINQALQTHVDLLKERKDIEEQRRQFSFISNQLIQSLRVYGVDNAKYYVQYCPMAFDNEGAEWLSQEDYVKNPYFGDKMMKCGTVQETISILK